MMAAQGLDRLIAPPGDEATLMPRATVAELVPTALTVQGLNKRFHDGVPVLTDVGFSVAGGSVTAVIGANGSGKSTLLRCLLRLIEPDTGRIHIAGSAVHTLAPRGLRQLRARVGFVFQRHHLCPQLSVLSNVLHGALARGRGARCWLQATAPAAERERALDCLARVGLADLALRKVATLSGGQSQRVAVARALMQDPVVLFADEPTASLDPAAGETVMALFAALCADHGLTVVFVSHHLDHARDYAHHIVGLRRGRVVIDGPSSRLSAADADGLYRTETAA